MVDISLPFDPNLPPRTLLFRVSDTDDGPRDRSFIIIATQSSLGATSSRTPAERIKILIEGTPELMRKAHARALEVYEHKLRRFRAWDPVVEAARYRQALEEYTKDSNNRVEDGAQQYSPPVPPVPPTEPLPVPGPISDFTKEGTTLATRLEWLTYMDFEDAGFDLLEVIEGCAGDLEHAIEVE